MGGEGGMGGHGGMGGEGGHAAPHWTYEGEEGPEHWGDLSEDWAACRDGMEQSPVDLEGDVPPSNHPEMEFDYAATALNIVNNGHTIQVNYAPGSMLTVDGHTWELVQFHFHAGSEHTVDGERSPLELHLVHRDADGNLAVVGVLFEEGEANAALDDIWANLPTEEGEPADIAGVMVDAATLLPPSHASWRYDGSLTTPPCSEGVSWFVLAQKVAISAEQLTAFTGIVHDNYRPAQPLNDRHIEAPHWGYGEDDLGPAHWGELSPVWAACGEGTEQSPVDLPGDVAPSTHPEMEFDYAATPLNIVNNGHTVQVNYAPGSMLTVDGHAWELLQFHFHAGSEHTIDGARSPLEMHLVHRDADGNLGVVGVLFEEGEANAALTDIWANLPAEEGEPADVAGVMADAAALLPAGHASWRYNGSLTTPPCSEGVSWFVMSEKVSISAEQLADFTGIIHDNYRPAQPLEERHIEAPHWGYEDDDLGPAHWAELSPWWAMCGEGMAQSPIDIPAITPADAPAMSFSYEPTPLEILNNGHTIQVNYRPGSTLDIDGAGWELVQFHFHARSEHTVDGMSYPLEMHLVHRNMAGELAVVGVLFEEGTANESLGALWANLPAVEGEPHTIPGVLFDVDALLPPTFGSWRYQGSLTTPPCSEGVNWFVLGQTVTASAAQLATFAAIFDHNYRPAQPLNDRVVTGGE